VFPRDAGMPDMPNQLPLPKPADKSLGAQPPSGLPGEKPAAPFRNGFLAPPPGLSSGPDMGGLLRALKRRWPLAFCVGVVLAAAAGYAAWTFLGAKQTAFAQVRVHQVPPWIIKPYMDTPESRNEFLTYLRIQATSIKSRMVLSGALQRPEVRAYGVSEQHLPDPVAWLEDELKVEFKENDEIITISLTGTNSGEVKAIVQAVAQEYDEKVARKEHADRLKRFETIKRLHDEANTKLKTHRDELKEMAKKYNVNDTPALSQKQLNLLTAIGEVRKNHALAQNTRMTLENRITNLKLQYKIVNEETLPDLTEAEVLAADPNSRATVARIAELEKTINKYAKGTVTRDQAEREMETKKKEMNEAKTKLGEEMTKRRRQDADRQYKANLALLESELDPMAKQEQVLIKELEDLTKKADDLGGTSTEFERLRAEVQISEAFVNHMAADLEVLDIERNSPPRASLYQEAELQKQDIKRQVAGTVLGPVGVLILVCFSVAWWEFRGRRIQTPDEVSTGLGIRVVGAVPDLSAKAQRRAIVHAEIDARGHLLLESIDAIRALLLRDSTVEATRVVMVTSAVGGEGKTTLASHLAGSLARAGRRTVLVDCDLRTPAIHQLFELPLQPGFSEVLLEETDLANAIQNTAVPGLSLLSAGQWDREVMQALAREGGRDLVERLREEFDFVIVDSHPVLAASDSLLLGQHADAVIVSVLRDVSQSPRVYAACQRLATLGIRILGAVVNAADDSDLYAPSGAYVLQTTR
jgi:polysaccharide biosynthesis transport protein